MARESYLQQLRDNERRHAAGEATSPSRAKNLVGEETKATRSSKGMYSLSKD